MNELSQKQVINVERINAGKRSKIKDEVLVVFSSVRVRNMVASYTSNLAEWKGSVPPINFRMEFPDHLAGVFKTLDSYGHVLKGKLGKTTRRNIKFDDTKKTLYMDICPHNEKEWLRVDYELAREEMELVKPRTASARSRFGSLGSSTAPLTLSSGASSYSTSMSRYVSAASSPSSQEWSSAIGQGDPSRREEAVTETAMETAMETAQDCGWTVPNA